MKTKMLTALAAFLVITPIVLQAKARPDLKVHLHEITLPAPYDGIPAVMRHQFSRNQTPDVFAEKVLKDVKRFSISKDKLQAQDMPKYERFYQAAITAHVIGQRLRADLNGDRKIRQPEADNYAILALKAENVSRKKLERINRDIMKADANGDYIIDMEEMGYYDPEDVKQLNSARMLNHIKSYMALDPNKDGILTFEELEQIAMQAFAIVDKDGDKLISDSEYEQYFNVTMLRMNHESAEKLKKQWKRE